MYKSKLYRKRFYSDDFVKPLYERYILGEINKGNTKPSTLYELELYHDQVLESLEGDRRCVISENNYKGEVPQTFKNRIHVDRQINFLMLLLLINSLTLFTLSLITWFVEKEKFSLVFVYGGLSTLFFLVLLAGTATKAPRDIQIDEEVLNMFIKQKQSL